MRHRMTTTLFTKTLWLALCAGVGSAHAGLVVRGLEFEAFAQVVQVDSTGTHGAQDHHVRQATCFFNVCATTNNGTPGILASAEPLTTQRAHAFQDGWGAFGQRQTVGLTNYQSGVQQVQGQTYTRFSQQVGSDAVNSLLQLDFRWLGSRVAAGTYYGEGLIDASSQVQVMVSRNGGPEEMIWGFIDRTRKVPGSPGGMFSDQHLDVDVQGVGLPSRQFETAWREFMVWGDIHRGAAFGTFDFGTLSPGETFTLTYVARTDLVMDGVTYASRGELLLDDPVQLRQSAFTFRGLDYTFAGDVNDPTTGVPEPSSLALLLAAGALPWWRRRDQAARRLWGSIGLPVRDPGAMMSGLTNPTGDNTCSEWPGSQRWWSFWRAVRPTSPQRATPMPATPCVR